ncbi:MAG: hypothetical protein V4465_02125, partial [Patescibacteria group bacterium]
MSTRIHGSVVRALFANPLGINVFVFANQEGLHGFEFITRETQARILRTKPFLPTQMAVADAVTKFMTQVYEVAKRRCTERGEDVYDHFDTDEFRGLNRIFCTDFYYEALEQSV